MQQYYVGECEGLSLLYAAMAYISDLPVVVQIGYLNPQGQGVFYEGYGRGIELNA